jgi:sigma-B regulation protein RsbU (phosphoserine phosphatase)
MPPTDLHLAPPSPIDEPKRLSRRIEPIYADLPIDRPADMFRLALDRTRERLGTECNIEATLLARFEAGRWIAHTGSDERLLDKLRRLSRAEHEIFLAEKTAFWKDPFPAAVWLLGGRAEWLALLRLARPPDAGVELLLEMARLAVQQRALEAGWTSILDRARAIQRSLLPDPLPAFDGFELAARSESADAVGGDVYDAIPLAPDAVGLMIGDASGHGLPAALEARDVVVGLRMGAARHLKIDATIERLNDILCGSTLSSRFVSLVYGELDRSGWFDYINAGHPAPLVVTRDSVLPLPATGRVLGVSTNAAYRIGHAEIPPGGALLLYTDGVTECPSPSGEEFGIERLSGIVQVLLDAPAEHVVTTVFEALREHAGDERPPDDASIFLARRLAGRASTAS